MNTPAKIIELFPKQLETEPINPFISQKKIRTKENIINFEMFKKYSLIVVTC